MSDLRTRIATVLADADGMPWDMWSKPSQDGYLLRADAVIRELKLEPEYRFYPNDPPRARHVTVRGQPHEG